MPKREDEPRPAETSGMGDPELETMLFWEKNKKAIIAGVIAAVILAFGVGAYFIIGHLRATESAAALARAESIADWQQVIQDFPGSNPAGEALLLVARSQREGGDLAASSASYRKMLDDYPKHPLVGLAAIGLAGNLAAEGKDGDAIAAYEQAAVRFPNSFTAPVALLNKAQLTIAEGDRKQGLEALRTLQNQYPDSISARVSERQLDDLAAFLEAEALPAASPADTVPDDPTATPAPEAASESSSTGPDAEASAASEPTPSP